MPGMASLLCLQWLLCPDGGGLPVLARAGAGPGWEALGFPLSTRAGGSDVQPRPPAFDSRLKGTSRLRELAELRGPEGGEAFGGAVCWRPVWFLRKDGH